MVAKGNDGKRPSSLAMMVDNAPGQTRSRADVGLSSEERSFLEELEHEGVVDLMVFDDGGADGGLRSECRADVERLAHQAAVAAAALQTLVNADEQVRASWP